ncbi:MAG: hypothetical protein AB8G23_19735 [Myxococcota bacterium]
MKRGMTWIRYGVCTCLGLAVIGLAAVSSLGDDANAPSRAGHPNPPDIAG